MLTPKDCIKAPVRSCVSASSSTKVLTGGAEALAAAAARRSPAAWVRFLRHCGHVPLLVPIHRWMQPRCTRAPQHSSATVGASSRHTMHCPARHSSRARLMMASRSAGVVLFTPGFTVVVLAFVSVLVDPAPKASVPKEPVPHPPALGALPPPALPAAAAAVLGFAYVQPPAEVVAGVPQPPAAAAAVLVVVAEPKPPDAAAAGFRV
jgi:hypothetical protein